jgi:hypothetical protein
MQGLPGRHGGGTGHGHGRGISSATICAEVRLGRQKAAIKRSERMETPVEWVLLWDVSQGLTCTTIALGSASPALGPAIVG